MHGRSMSRTAPFAKMPSEDLVFYEKGYTYRGFKTYTAMLALDPHLRDTWKHTMDALALIWCFERKSYGLSMD